MKVKKYEIYRHHAWAGLGLLSVFLAIRYFIFIPWIVSLIIVSILSIYILASIALTYKYYRYVGEAKAKTAEEKEMEKIRKKEIKAALKMEKKRLKAEIKKNKRK